MWCSMRMACLVCVCACVVAGAAQGQVNESTPGYFPFWIPAYDVTPSFTDMSFLSPDPAGAKGRAVNRDGHFYDAEGNRLRLLGSNLCFHGPFPEKETAEAIAGHLRKLGMNVIRFHHMDMGSAPRGIWLPDYSGLDPAQVDKLDWLIFQLKQHGIYANVNLHVSRTYAGMPSEGPREFVFGKKIDNFYPEFIEAQKVYARDLLTHRNPYTNTTYAEEPAVLVVEINNENALTGADWADLQAMPDPYRAELVRQWQAWIKGRYETTERLRAHWDETSVPLGEEMTENRAFDPDFRGWTLEQHNGAELTAEAVEDSGAELGRAAKLTASKTGAVQWSMQVHQIGLDLTENMPYTLRFKARAGAPCSIHAYVGLDKAPWSNCGLRAEVALDTEWRAFEFTFRCERPEPDHCRVSFNLNNQVGTFWIADVSLKPGGLLGLPADQSIEAGTIGLPGTNASDSQSEDFYRFLQETELAYVREMVRFLKEDLGVGAFICCTQANYGGRFGMYREGTLSDYVDMHSYWEHPSFPGKPWDSGNWHIGNTSMAAKPVYSTFRHLTWMRNVEKPYTVSEYDHPAPNDHAVELFPMLASVAAFQDWDGIYQFDYRSGAVGEEERRLSGYFELWSHPGKQAFLPAAAVMFRMGAVQAASDPVAAVLPCGDLPRSVVTDTRFDEGIQELYPVALTRAVGHRITDGTGPAELPDGVKVDGPFVSSTGEIVWDATAPETAAYMVNAPAVRVAVGYIAGRDIALGDVTIRVDKAENNWAAVAVAALDGKPIAESARVLVTAVGRVENCDMGWDERRTTVGKNWGRAPVVAEGIEGVIHLPGSGQIAALDGTGTPKGAVETEPADGGMALRIGPHHATLWYGLTR